MTFRSECYINNRGKEDAMSAEKDARIKELERQNDILFAALACEINHNQHGVIAKMNSEGFRVGIAKYLINPEFRGLGIGIEEFAGVYKIAADRALAAQQTVEDEYDSSGRG